MKHLFQQFSKIVRKCYHLNSIQASPSTQKQVKIEMVLQILTILVIDLIILHPIYAEIDLLSLPSNLVEKVIQTDTLNPEIQKLCFMTGVSKIKFTKNEKLINIIIYILICNSIYTLNNFFYKNSGSIDNIPWILGGNSHYYNR